jgi:putative phosphoesterase
MAYIGLLSDTHGIFDNALAAFLKDVDEVWHAGDFGSTEVSGRIAAMKPLKGVYGNCDGQGIRLIHPHIQNFEIEGLRFLMIHIGGYPRSYDPSALRLINAYKPDVFICGHSHILKVVKDTTKNMMVINPGAAGLQGIHTLRTALRFRVENGALHDMEVGEWPKRSYL